MKVFFDCEFVERGTSIELISIGLIDERMNRLYVENSEFDLATMPDWHKENVLPHLKGGHYLKTRSEIAESIRNFTKGHPKVEFYAYYGAYDWVILCQLYDGMLNIPKNWNAWYHDTKLLHEQLAPNLRFSKLSNKAEHDALSDAIWNLDIYRQIQDHRLTIDNVRKILND